MAKNDDRYVFKISLSTAIKTSKVVGKILLTLSVLSLSATNQYMHDFVKDIVIEETGQFDIVSESTCCRQSAFIVNMCGLFSDNMNAYKVNTCCQLQDELINNCLFYKNNQMLK